MSKKRVSPFVTVLIVVLLCNYVYAEKNMCDVPDVGTISPGDFKTSLGLTNYWQGSVGGMNTKNSDRISGLYDFDICYLLGAKEHSEGLGDYSLLEISTQSSFGHGITDSKVGSFFNLNEGVKGDYAIIADKLFVEFTGFDRLFTINIGKIDFIDYFDHSAAANEFRDQFFAYPLVQTDNIPFPSKGLGVRAQYDPSPLWYAELGIGDAKASSRETGFNTAFGDDPEYFGIAEVGLRQDFFDKKGTYRFMLWHQSEDKSYLDGSGKTKRNDTGFALSFDQQLTEKLTGFFRYGCTDGKVNEEVDFLSFGGQIEGIFKKNDIFAVGFAQGFRSLDSITALDEREINFLEAYYKITVNKNLEISPDYQLVMNPGGLKSESPANVFGLRCRMKF
jgi:carbohydrate-selective porin OprB